MVKDYFHRNVLKGCVLRLLIAAGVVPSSIGRRNYSARNIQRVHCINILICVKLAFENRENSTVLKFERYLHNESVMD